MKKLSLIIIFVSTIGLWGLNAQSDYSLEFNKETKSLVRHLLVYKHPSWVAKVVTKESKEFYFASPKSMFEFYFDPQKWADTKVDDANTLKEIVVTDYKTHKAINAKGAFYVYGSNKTSPSGDDLPAFASYDDANEFAQHNNGKRIFSFKEVKKALIELLNGDI